MSARTRRRLSEASFGQEWRPFGHMAGWLIEATTPRELPKFLAYLREARREVACDE